MATTVKCPTCRRQVEWSAESLYRPFCSDRCRLIDLGAWVAEQHKISDEPGTADPTQALGSRTDSPDS